MAAPSGTVHALMDMMLPDGLTVGLAGILLSLIHIFYNTYSGTEYEGTDDETVAAVTGGSYSTYEEWADSVRDGYTQ